ncbi:hypothetical protein Bb109J_c1953 [Bdellovibrio bacteriovorus]|uniref:phage tail tape measure protein n=1 Tax=Bdellovibrio bacteriovorus TaxID=959 RepID=UPI00045BF68C|nr:phage tail tape measure protein [Bdellovibrio bacteriovorus]AHZ84643.1 hypothetical protein EP01_06790 [Bdellovibrio bacteriovorus]BEV68533.1 hypothetical protein Bb109J_c1953 [Bdellovibrio bacteriovorus]
MADALVVKVSADLKNYEKEMKKISDQTAALAEAISEVGKYSAAAFAGLAAIIGLNIREFSRFDNEVRAVKTLLDESSFGAKGLEAGFRDMKNEALQLAKTVPGSISSMNKALFDTVSAGIDASQAVNVVASASKLAVAGVTDLSVATDGLTSALNAYNLKADDAERVGSKFFTAQKYGKTTIEQLSDGFGKVGASASALGVSLDEVLATVSAVTLGGVKTAEAYTGLKAVLTGIAKPTSEAKEEAKRLGVEFDATALRTKGLEKFLGDLQAANGFTRDSITKLFGSIEAANVLFALTGNQADAFKNVLKELSNETKTAETFTKAYETQNASSSNQVEIFKNKLQVLAILLGEKLTPAFDSVLGVGSDFLDIMSGSDGMTSFLAVTLAISAALTGLAAALAVVTIGAFQFRTAALALTGTQSLAAAATLLWAGAINALSTAWIALTGPVGIAVVAIAAVVAAIGAVTYAVYSFREEIYAGFMGAVEFVKTAMSGMVDVFLGYAEMVLGILTLNWSRIQEGGRSFASGFTRIFREGGRDAAEAFNAEMAKAKAPSVENSPMPQQSYVSPIVGAAMGGLPGGSASFYDEMIKAQESAQSRQQESASAHEERMAKIRADSAARQAAINKEFAEQLEAARGEERAKEIESSFSKNQQIQMGQVEHNTRMLEMKIEAQELDRQADLSDQALVMEARAAHNLAMAELELQNRQLDAETKLSDDELKRNLQMNHENEILRIRQDARLTDLDAENRVSREVLALELKENNTRKEEEIKFGKDIAAAKALFRSEDFKNTGKILGDLSTLQRSKNKEFFEIGKAASLAQGIVNIAQGVTEAWKLGPILGPIGAAAVLAAGTVQLSAISGQTLAMAEGGIVTGGIPGRDSVPILGMPGELMVPTKNFDEVINSVAAKRNFENFGLSGSEGGVSEVIIGFKENAFEIIEQNLSRRRALGVGVG